MGRSKETRTDELATRKICLDEESQYNVEESAGGSRVHKGGGQAEEAVRRRKQSIEGYLLDNSQLSGREVTRRPVRRVAVLHARIKESQP